jgi:phosphoadenosine phosphosulfate reductase
MDGMARLTQADLHEMNQNFEERTPQELLRWTREVFGNRVAALSAMQKAGSVVCHMLRALQLPMKVLFVDTGVNFAETLVTRDRIAREYNLDVVTLVPKLTMEEQTARFGVLYLSSEGQQQCCHMRKNEPLLSVKGQFDAFIGSLRRSEGGQREKCPILAVDPEMNCLRVNPLASFSDKQLDDYIQAHGVIVNPLHAQGYTTIGCNRCTTPVLPGEPPRAGRWRHLGPWSAYCGINPTDFAREESVAIDLSQDLVDRILGRRTDFVI